MTYFQNKKCFVITPIGNEDSDTRRHIDGIIDAALKPVLADHFNFDMTVAHRIDLPGAIPKQVINEIYNSELVVANLTGNNPNVMYELALRHCFGTPVIVIAEKGTIIPADINSEITIFYINDAKGVIDLKDNLKRMVETVLEDDKKEQLGPVYDALKSQLDTDSVISHIQSEKDIDAFGLITSRLDSLENSINHINARGFSKIGCDNDVVLVILYDEIGGVPFKILFIESIRPFIRKMTNYFKVQDTSDDKCIKIHLSELSEIDKKATVNMITGLLEEHGYKRVKVFFV